MFIHMYHIMYLLTAGETFLREVRHWVQRRAWVDQIIRRRMVMIVTMAIVMMRMTKMVMIMVRYWVQTAEPGFKRL